ncbi:hypothetical protein [Methylobacterium sp.]|uniref:hypothetical protein n=1 Tax=Methylobacterium sp. TaxID=409 RepID=UPI003B0169D2
MPAEFADRVILVTENDLHRDLVHDAELIHEVRGDDAPEDDRIVTGLVGHLNGMTTVGSLVAASGLAGRAFRAAVRLIADGSLRIVGRRRIGYATQVERVGGLS